MPGDLLRQIEQHPYPRFSAISIWEIGIKAARRRHDFTYAPRTILNWLDERRWAELPFTSEHAICAANLPLLHKDPFDRALIPQAQLEGLTLVTSDTKVTDYQAPIRLI